MTPKQRVLAIYPNAQAWRGWGESGLVAIWDGIRGVGKRLGRHMESEDGAWSSAALNIPEAPPVAEVTTDASAAATFHGKKIIYSNQIADSTPLLRLQDVEEILAAPKPPSPQEFEEWWDENKFNALPMVKHLARAAWNAARKAPSIEPEMRETIGG